jgi:hypothetical protein
MRLLRTEVTQLVQQRRVQETLYLGPEEGLALTYALTVENAAAEIQLRYTPVEITIVLPSALAEEWATSEQVGLYGSADVGPRGNIELLVEKDFACLDRKDPDNLDTFPNPKIGAPF